MTSLAMDYVAPFLIDLTQVKQGLSLNASLNRNAWVALCEHPQ